MREPLFWFKSKRYVGLERPTVYLAHEWNCPDLKGRDGITYLPQMLIFINITLSKSERESVCMHEHLHCGAWATAWLSKQAEERTVLNMTRSLWPMFKDMGLEWPELPDGYVELRREAKRLESKTRRK